MFPDSRPPLVVGPEAEKMGVGEMGFSPVNVLWHDAGVRGMVKEAQLDWPFSRPGAHDLVLVR